jgi:hypothetical protein
VPHSQVGESLSVVTVMRVSGFNWCLLLCLYSLKVTVWFWTG